MGNVSRPLIGLLVATVVFFALWIVALKPSSSTSGASQGLGHFQSAINQAKASVASQNAAAANANAASATSTPSTAAGASTAASPAPSATAPAPSKAAAKAATAKSAATTSATHAVSRTRTATPASTLHTATATQRRNVVERALAAHKVLALLVYNPAGSDDLAVKRELRAIPTRGGRVVKLAIPVGEITHYPVITNQVPIQASPTLVVVDSRAQAFTLVGFADGFEIAQRIDNALSVH